MLTMQSMTIQLKSDRPCDSISCSRRRQIGQVRSSDRSKYAPAAFERRHIHAFPCVTAPGHLRHGSPCILAAPRGACPPWDSIPQHLRLCFINIPPRLCANAATSAAPPPPPPGRRRTLLSDPSVHDYRAELASPHGGGDDQAVGAAGLDAQEKRAARMAAAVLLPRAAHLPLLLRVQGFRGESVVGRARERRHTRV